MCQTLSSPYTRLPLKNVCIRRLAQHVIFYPNQPSDRPKPSFDANTPEEISFREQFSGSSSNIPPTFEPNIMVELASPIAYSHKMTDFDVPPESIENLVRQQLSQTRSENTSNRNSSLEFDTTQAQLEKQSVEAMQRQRAGLPPICIPSHSSVPISFSDDSDDEENKLNAPISSMSSLFSTYGLKTEEKTFEISKDLLRAQKRTEHISTTSLQDSFASLQIQDTDSSQHHLLRDLSVLDSQLNLTKNLFAKETVFRGLINPLAQIFVEKVIRREALRQIVDDYKGKIKLSASDIQEAHKFTNISSLTEIFSSRMAAPKLRDLQSLQPQCWLNDEVINGYLWLLLKRSERVLVENYTSDTLQDDLCSSAVALQSFFDKNTSQKPLFGSELSAYDGNGRQTGEAMLLSSPSINFSRHPPSKFCLKVDQNPIPIQSRLKIHIFSTQFLVKMARPGSKFEYQYDSVKNWSRRQKVILSSMDIVLIPCHVQGNHWTLSCINFAKKRVEYFDSLFGSDWGILDVLLQYVADEALTHENGRVEDMSRWTKIIHKNIPKQRNGFDCGVFVLKMAEFLSSGRPLYNTKLNEAAFKQEDISQFRLQIALALKNQHVE